VFTPLLVFSPTTGVADNFHLIVGQKTNNGSNRYIRCFTPLLVFFTNNKPELIIPPLDWSQDQQWSE